MHLPRNGSSMHVLIYRLARELILATLPISAAYAMDAHTAAQDSQPKFIKEGSAMTGLCIDIFKALKRTDPDLKVPPFNGFPLPASH